MKKLVFTFYDKEKYVLHELLKYYVKMGLKIKRVHRVITFDEKDIMKDYIEFNTKMRMNGKTKFEKNFYKLMNNSLFRKNDGKYSKSGEHQAYDQRKRLLMLSQKVELSRQESV